jgi:hypothetical protein
MALNKTSIHWTSTEDKTLREAVRQGANNLGEVTSRSAWVKIAAQVTKVHGHKRTYEACRTRATSRRWCKPLKSFATPDIRRLNADARNGLPVAEVKIPTGGLQMTERRPIPPPPPPEWKSLFSGLLRQIVADEIAKPESAVHQTIQEVVVTEVTRQLEALLK